MSVRVMAAAWDLAIPTTDKFVLLALADWSNDDGHCWPSINQLMTKCSLSERAVQGALKRLADGGQIKREMKPGKGTIYTVTPRTTCTPADDAPPQQVRQTPARRAPNTLVTTNSSEAKASSARAKPIKFEVPSWVPRKPWDAFVEMRAKSGSRMTDHAKGLAIAELEKLKAEGCDPSSVLNQSIMKSWRGLFPVKGSQSQTGSGGSDLYAAVKRLAA